MWVVISTPNQNFEVTSLAIIQGMETHYSQSEHYSIRLKNNPERCFWAQIQRTMVTLEQVSQPWPYWQLGPIAAGVVLCSVGCRTMFHTSALDTTRSDQYLFCQELLDSLKSPNFYNWAKCLMGLCIFGVWDHLRTLGPFCPKGPLLLPLNI